MVHRRRLHAHGLRCIPGHHGTFGGTQGVKGRHGILGYADIDHFHHLRCRRLHLHLFRGCVLQETRIASGYVPRSGLRSGRFPDLFDGRVRLLHVLSGFRIRRIRLRSLFHAVNIDDNAQVVQRQEGIGLGTVFGRFRTVHTNRYAGPRTDHRECQFADVIHRGGRLHGLGVAADTAHSQERSVRDGDGAPWREGLCHRAQGGR